MINNKIVIIRTPEMESDFYKEHSKRISDMFKVSNKYLSVNKLESLNMNPESRKNIYYSLAKEFGNYFKQLNEKREEEMKHDKIMNKLRTKVFKDQKLNILEKDYLDNECGKFYERYYDDFINSWNIKLSYYFLNFEFGNYKDYFKAVAILEKHKKNPFEHDWIKTELKKVISDSILKNDKSTYHELYSTKRYTVGFFVDESKVVLHDKKEDKSYFRFVEYNELF